MGCASSDEIKENENKPKKPKKSKEGSINKNLKINILSKDSNLELNNNYQNNPLLSPKYVQPTSRSKKEKEKTFSSSYRQLDAKSKISFNEEEEKEERNKNFKNIEISFPQTVSYEGDMNLDSDIENKKLNNNFGPVPFNLKETIIKKNNIKYAILEKDNESEENSNAKSFKNMKNDIYNLNLNQNYNKKIDKKIIDQYKEQKYKYFISRNNINEDNKITDANSLTKKFVRKYITTNSKSLENNELGGLLSEEEKKLSFSFEDLIPLQTDKPSKKYKVLSVIGNGSYGKVYKAINLTTENFVAIKAIKKKEEEKNEEGIGIKNEINVLKKLSHPNIVKIYEFYDIKDSYYLITEFCRFGELYKYYKFHFSEKQICVLFYQIFSGLIYLHENNILHGDLKLENIMIDAIEKDNTSCEPYFYIKIIDFGSAKIFSKHKKENKIIGSTYYIAPEVLKQEYNEKCDTWSVGVLLYMIITKKAPFNGINNEVIAEKIEEGNYNKKNKNLTESSPELQDLLSKLLEIDADKRFSARQALDHPWFKNFGGRALFSNFNTEEIKKIIDNLFKFKSNNKLQELVLAFLVHNSPSTEETLLILKIFRYFNKSGNCKLLKEELIDGLYKYKSKEEVDSKVEELFKILDTNNNGYIEYEKFLEACIDINKLFSKENLKYAFQFIDEEKSNGIDGKKIINAFKANSNKVLEAVFNNLLIKVDEDGDGIINFTEFEKLLLS